MFFQLFACLSSLASRIDTVCCRVVRSLAATVDKTVVVVVSALNIARKSSSSTSSPYPPPLVPPPTKTLPWDIPGTPTLSNGVYRPPLVLWMVVVLFIIMAVAGASCAIVKTGVLFRAQKAVFKLGQAIKHHVNQALFTFIALQLFVAGDTIKVLFVDLFGHLWHGHRQASLALRLIEPHAVETIAAVDDVFPSPAPQALPGFEAILHLDLTWHAIARAFAKLPGSNVFVDLPAPRRANGFWGSSSWKTVSTLGVKTVIQPAALRVVKFLGQGGFGAVLQVKVHGKTLALKRLVNANKRSRRIWDAFAAEVMVHQLMADHPAFPNVHAVFKGPGFLYVAMDCGVASFATIGRMSLRNALFYSGQLVLALHALHKRGVVHLDIKPENLLVGADGNLLVIDFGLARKLDSQPVDPSKFPTWNSVRLARTDRFPLLWVGPQNPHKDDVVCGTLQYMCPQIHFGLAYSFGADLWALGVVMHEWITGEMPDIYEVEGRNIHAWRASPKYWYSPVDRSFFAQIFCVDDPGRFAHYQELKAHRIWQPPNRSWDWNSLEKRQHCPPFSPG